jgi:hypothetical protein
MFRAFLWTGIGAAVGYFTMETMVYQFVPPEQIAFQSRSSWFSVMAVGVILGSAFGASSARRARSGVSCAHSGRSCVHDSTATSQDRRRRPNALDARDTQSSPCSLSDKLPKSPKTSEDWR